jgi:ferrous iron transport protein B
MLSFILALPAAELMLPLAISGCTGGVALFGETADIPAAFSVMGWGGTTVVCAIIFMMFPFPCATTLTTVYRETESVKTTLLSAMIPTAIGYFLCVTVNVLAKLF